MFSNTGDVEAEAFASKLRERFGDEAVRESSVIDVRLYLIDESAASFNQNRSTPAPTFDAAASITMQGDPASWAALKDCANMARIQIYDVLPRRIKIYPRSWPDGERTPGIVMFSPVHRAASLSREEFDAHWRDRHGPLALKHHVGMWDYTQNFVVRPRDPAAPAYDGFAILGFASEEDFRDRLFDNKAGTRVIMEDTARFLDLKRGASMMAAEYVIKSR